MAFADDTLTINLDTLFTEVVNASLLESRTLKQGVQDFDIGMINDEERDFYDTHVVQALDNAAMNIGAYLVEYGLSDGSGDQTYEYLFVEDTLTDQMGKMFGVNLVKYLKSYVLMEWFKRFPEFSANSQTNGQQADMALSAMKSNVLFGKKPQKKYRAY